jgi:hypothetical protein
MPTPIKAQAPAKRQHAFPLASAIFMFLFLLQTRRTLVENYMLENAKYGCVPSGQVGAFDASRETSSWRIVHRPAYPLPQNRSSKARQFMVKWVSEFPGSVKRFFEGFSSGFPRVFRQNPGRDPRGHKARDRTAASDPADFGRCTRNQASVQQNCVRYDQLGFRNPWSVRR